MDFNKGSKTLNKNIKKQLKTESSVKLNNSKGLEEENQELWINEFDASISEESKTTSPRPQNSTETKNHSKHNKTNYSEIDFVKKKTQDEDYPIET